MLVFWSFLAEIIKGQGLRHDIPMSFGRIAQALKIKGRHELMAMGVTDVFKTLRLE